VQTPAVHAWRLLVRHREGSLEAAVGQTRRRNLAVSFGVLLVLGLATGLLVVTAQRARHLAGQQMAFVAGVSHELRTPLAVICSAAENLADGIVQDPEQAGRYGVLIRDEGRRLSGMVEQVLGLVAAGSGRQTYAFAAAALPDVLARAEADNRSLLDQAGMTLETRVSHALPPVRADLAALGAALGNLIQNAVKYAGEGGWVGLEAAASPDASHVEITVRDRGPGIPAGELSQLFKPFFRGRAARDAQIHGNGLGLSLVQHIIAAHGGRVTAASIPGRGSAFTIHLPALPETDR
jgi:signal transduction histidine kinase